MISRPLYIIYEAVYFLFSLLSRVVNAAFFKGSMQQTISARTYVLSHDNPKWERRRKIIDTIFFWEEDHCRKSWWAEVNRARKTLARNEALPDEAEV